MKLIRIFEYRKGLLGLGHLKQIVGKSKRFIERRTKTDTQQKTSSQPPGGVTESSMIVNETVNETMKSNHRWVPTILSGNSVSMHLDGNM